FVHKQSCEGVKSELDLFTVPPTQTSIIDSHVVEHQPLSSLDSGGPIEFLIPGSGDDYLDLANTILHVQAKVTRANGDDLDLADPVGPVNNWLHALISQADVSLNNTLVTPSTNTYAYRALIETLLSYGPDAKDTQLTSQLWHKDTATRMDAVEIADGPAANEGFVARRENILRSRVVDMMGRLHVDLFLQDKFLINGVDVKIRLVRSKPAFALMAGGVNPDYKIQIVNACLFAKKVTVNPSVQIAHVKALEKSTVKYPMRSVECKVYSIPAGTRSHTNNAISFLAVYVDGRQIPSKPFQPNFEDDLFVRSYMSLFSSTGKLWQDEGNGLTRSDYRHGYTFFGFDLTPDQCDGPCFHLVQKGNLRIEVHFRNALLNTVNVVAYAELESVLEIDKNRNIIYDY
ncbi:hypothetical protein LSAT2_015400, partial [Lamellibrachia satsuma]